MPCVVRWPGVIKPGTIVNDIMSHEDWLPTFLAAAGDADVKTKLLTGLHAGDKTFKVHLDGYNFLPFFKGEDAKGPRHEIFYFDDSANMNALRYDDWKITFQVIEGNMFNGKLVAPNMPFVVNLRQDPFERYPTESLMYMEWMSAQGMGVPARARDRRPVPAVLPGIPAEPEARQLRHRQGPRSHPDRLPRRQGSKQQRSRATSMKKLLVVTACARGPHRLRADGVARAASAVAGRRGARYAGRAARGARRRGGAAGAGPCLLAGARRRAAAGPRAASSPPCCSTTWRRWRCSFTRALV